MWSNRKNKTRGRLGGFLDEGSEMEGSYRCAGTVMMDAKFHGEIVSKDTLVIGEQGVVHGNVQTTTLVVRGEFVGDVIASERVELKATARVTGDIESPVIVMEVGALHDGHCRMAKTKSGELPLSVVVPIKG